MVDWVKRAREDAKKTITSPITQRDFIIRKLTSSELVEAGMSPLISEEKPKVPENNLEAMAWMASHGDKVALAQTRHVLTQGVVEPKVVYGDESAVPADGSAVHARWICEDETWLFISILEFSGISNEENREKLKEIIKNVNGSGASSDAAGISESSQANS
jgi:hypothetical protein